MVYVTGDCHADFDKFSDLVFKDEKKLTRNDYVIVCGDFGIWHDTNNERVALNNLSRKNYNILFVDGNHENFDRLYGDEFKTVDFHGGKAHKIRDNIFHLMRGYVFELCGKTFFAFGGASSHDIRDGILDRNDFNSEEEFNETCWIMRYQRMMFRINHLSWWKEELPNEIEMERGLENLKKYNNKVDYIISHCCCDEIASAIVDNPDEYKSDILTEYFENINDNVKFKKWYFGHYHHDFVVDDKYVLLYHKFRKVDTDV